MKFKVKAPFNPTGDQPTAIKSLVNGIKSRFDNQVLLGVTGSGKTFTIAKVIEELNKPALIISHNKTLAAQLYQEFKEFFPENAVNYFVSYYDFYQPEAYIPKSDTYIEKETQINDQIDKLRLASTTNILTRKDCLVVASVSCIYNLGDPRNYQNFTMEIRSGEKITRDQIIKRLLDLQYQRNDFGAHRATFRVRGENIDVFLAYEETLLRISCDLQKIIKIEKLDGLTGKLIEKFEHYLIYPAKHYLTETQNRLHIFNQIKTDLKSQVEYFTKNNKLVEAQRLSQRVDFDLEMIEEMGYVNGIENYSRYFDGRRTGDPPFTLLDYFNFAYRKNWLLIIDESHMTVPQLNGMYNGDRSRKTTLIDFGFRLPSAIDNRPLKFSEFISLIPQTIYVSATPAQWEINISKGQIAQQLIRPTGIVDPKVKIVPTQGQIVHLIKEIVNKKRKHARVLVTTLTKKMAEDLATFMEEKKYLKLAEFKELKKKELPKVHYLHSDIVTLERSDILDDLRLGNYDVLIGINLLREGLDLPEVSLVAILDADKEGFLRSQTSLIQTMGRAARHTDGEVIMYADTITGSMQRAIAEIERRRKIQLKYNHDHAIVARKITKPIREKLVEKDTESNVIDRIFESKSNYEKLLKLNTEDLTPFDIKKTIKGLEKEMRIASSDLNFELAAVLRDKIIELKTLN